MPFVLYYQHIIFIIVPILYDWEHQFEYIIYVIIIKVQVQYTYRYTFINRRIIIIYSITIRWDALYMIFHWSTTHTWCQFFRCYILFCINSYMNKIVWFYLFHGTYTTWSINQRWWEFFPLVSRIAMICRLSLP